MSHESRLRGRDAKYLEARRAALEEAVQRFEGRNVKKLTNAQEELVIVQQILVERIERQQVESHDNVRDLVEQGESEQISEYVSMHEIKSIAENGLQMIRNKIAQDANLGIFKFVVDGVRQKIKISWAEFGDGDFSNAKYQELLAQSQPSIFTVSLTGLDKFLQFSKKRDSFMGKNEFFTSYPHTTEWAGVKLAGYMSEHACAVDTFRAKNLINCDNISGIIGRYGAINALSDNQYLSLLKSRTQVFSKSTVDSLVQILKSDPEKIMSLVCDLDIAANMPMPIHEQEMIERFYQHLASYATESKIQACSVQGVFTGALEVKDTILKDDEMRLLERQAREFYSRIPQKVEHSELRKVLEVICPDFLENDEVSNYCMAVEASGRHYLIGYHYQAEDGDVEFHSSFQQHSAELMSWVSLVAEEDRITHKCYSDYLHIDSESAVGHVALLLPTMQEIENHFLSSEVVEGRFLPHDQNDEPAEHPSEDILRLRDSHEETVQQFHPKLQSLKNVLLRNQVQAVFYWDNATSTEEEVQHAYDTAEPGHYVIVTLPEIGLQFAISDDTSKGTYVVRNTIAPTQYTAVDVKQLRDNFGATTIRWDTAEQFAHALENTIRQQRDNSKQVWPVHTSYPTPLDTFPNEIAIQALRYDFAQVAEKANRADRPWTLRSTDFSRIKSGDFDWSFGGNANGVIQLDRLAREFGLHDYAIKNRQRAEVQSLQNQFHTLDESDPDRNDTKKQLQSAMAELEDTEQNLRQHHFRSLILKTLLYEMHPEFRVAQQEKDEKEFAENSAQEKEG